MYLIHYLTIINIISFITCYIDKRLAVKGEYKKRISEKRLLELSLIGGALGMALGMNIFRHKTKKIKFVSVYFFIILWIIIVYYVYSKFLY